MCSNLAVSRVALLKNEAEQFIRYLKTLSSQAWGHPSACEGWTVADVLGHLTGQDFSPRILSGLKGDVSAPEGSPAVSDHDEDKFAQSIFRRAIDAKERMGDHLLSTFVQRVDETVQVFGGVAIDQWDTLCYWPPGPETVRTMLNMRISELVMHAWDICSQFETDYRLSQDSVLVLMDTVDRAVRRAFRPDTFWGEPVTYRFDITVPLEAKRDIVLTKDGGSVGSDGADAQVVFGCNAETYVMLMYGRLKLGDAIDLSLLSVKGDEALVDGFASRFKGG